jgi:hypothetical protein
VELSAAGDRGSCPTELPMPKPLVDDDGRPLRTGTVWTASAHIITAVLGSGVLSLTWAVAQLGWVAGPAVMVLFAAVICYTAILLTECYRSGDPVFGQRNRTYIDAVRAILGSSKERLCGVMHAAVQPLRHQHRGHHCRLRQHKVINAPNTALLDRDMSTSVM